MEQLATIIAGATPLVYAAIGETINEKAGVVNLSLDGSILLSAMTGFAVAFETGNVLLGFLGAMMVSVLIASIVAFASIRLRINQIATGFVLFLLATSLALFLGNSYVGKLGPKVPAWKVPLLSDIPFVGTVFFQHNLSVYGSYVAIIVAYLFLFRSRRGLILLGVGERPEAAHARGIKVNRLRYIYTVAGGGLVGLAGAAVSLDQIAGWRETGTRNLGWIALAFVIFGGWHPFRVALGCYLYRFLLFLGGTQTFQNILPTQILTTLPFVLMILTLSAVSSDWFRHLGDRFTRVRNFLASDPPTAIGTTFSPE